MASIRDDISQRSSWFAETQMESVKWVQTDIVEGTSNSCPIPVHEG